MDKSPPHKNYSEGTHLRKGPREGEAGSSNQEKGRATRKRDRRGMKASTETPTPTAPRGKEGKTQQRKSSTETPTPTVQRGKEGKAPLPTPRTMKKTTCQKKQVATPGTTWKEPPAQKHTSSGTTGVAKVKRETMGRSHHIAKGRRGKPSHTQSTEQPNLGPSGTQAVGWLKGLEQMDQICPKAWANSGIRAGRRIPPRLQSPILQHPNQHLPTPRRGSM